MRLEQLKELGLSEGEVNVYGALLDLGVTSLQRIHEKTGIERRNIYDILNKLIEKGLISYVQEKGARVYQCTNPNVIKEQVENKEKKLKEIKKVLPEIKSLFLNRKPEIGAEVFRGLSALKTLMDESLDYKEQYWIGGNSEVENTSLAIWFKHWMTRRKEKKIIMKDLVDYGTFLEGLEPKNIEEHKKNYYKYCSLPKDLSSPMVILIFGNKVCQIIWSGNQPFAFVIESKDVKDSFMKYFNYFWKEPW